MKKITVIGSGVWGTTISNLLAKNSNQVFLSSITKEIILEINNNRTNQKFLPNLKLSNNIIAIGDFAEKSLESDLIFIVTPSFAVFDILTSLSKLDLKKDCGIIICSKGIDPNSLSFLSDVFKNIFKSDNFAILSGPNFAVEVATEVPTVTTIATKNKIIFENVKEALNNNYFKVEYFSDPKTAEICAVVKNIIAIGCGIIDGFDIGVNAKSALVLKGIKEIQILCKAFEASDKIDNAAGFGDIFLTCSSKKSRNNSLGIMLALGKSYEEIVKETKKTYEGAFSATLIAKIAKKLGLNLVLCEEISEILSNNLPTSEIKLRIIKAILN